jgi:ankyrin repeat protein
MAATFKKHLRSLKSLPCIKKTDTVELLYQNNASQEGIDEMYLIAAAYMGNSELVSSLISQNIDLNLMSYDGYTALMYAIKNGHLDVVNLLIEAGANLNLVGRETALICGVMRRDQNLVEFLLSSGANINLKNIYGDSPIYFARQKKDKLHELFKNLSTGN